MINITLEEATARGWLPRIEYHVITDESLDDKALQKIASEIRQGKKRFTLAEVNRRIFIKKRDVEVARIINGYEEKSIVFCASIHHAERMKKALKLSAVFHSTTGRTQKDTWKKNQAVLTKLKNGIIRRVCAVNAFNEGIDVPTIGLAAFCRVTGVLTVFRQQLGRGLRPGKDKLIVLDFVGNLERIQLVLEMMNKISDLHEKYTSKEERNREGYERQRFEVSGKGFEFTFSDKVVDLMEVLEHVERDFYPTWQEASKAAQALGIKSIPEYQKRYREDPRLPAILGQAYIDYPGIDMFLGKIYNRRNLYPTWQDASKVSIGLKIVSYSDYGEKRSADSRLPRSPHKYYVDFPGYDKFLGKDTSEILTRKRYKTWVEAGRAASKLGIKNAKEYARKYKTDPRLPSGPTGYYADFPGFKKFLEKKYPTWQQASVGAQKLKVKTMRDYQKKYKKDPQLPSSPNKEYKNFPGWTKFLKQR